MRCCEAPGSGVLLLAGVACFVNRLSSLLFPRLGASNHLKKWSLFSQLYTC